MDERRRTTDDGNRSAQKDQAPCFFVIIFEGRTGSSYTVTALNRHPHILCYPEIMANYTHREQRAMLNAIAEGQSIGHINPFAEDRLYHWGRRCGRIDEQTVGFKVKIQDICDLVHFDGHLRRHDYRLLYLKRRNVLKSALSWLNARRLRQQYGLHWNAAQKKQVQGALHVDPDALLFELKRRIRFERWHERFYACYDGDKRLFFYEDLLNHHAGFFADMLAFLGVEPYPIQGVFLKNTPDRLRDAIVNYDEIRTLFAGTLFERYFDDE